MNCFSYWGCAFSHVLVRRVCHQHHAITLGLLEHNYGLLPALITIDAASDACQRPALLIFCLAATLPRADGVSIRLLLHVLNTKYAACLLLTGAWHLVPIC